MKCVCVGGGGGSIVTVTLFCIQHYCETTYFWLTIQDSCWRGRRYTHTNTQTHKQYWPLYCIGLIGAYSNYTDKSAIPSHWHLVVTRQQLLPRCEVLCAHGLSGQCSVAQVVLRQVACQQVVWRRRERRRERGKGGREGRVRGDREVVRYGDGGRGNL